MPNFIGTLLTPVINGVRSSVTSHRGQCTWKFSQIKDPVATIIGKNNITKDGICEMLSAKWIECHAHDDHLANWLKGGGNQEIDPSKIRLLMQLFAIGETMNPGAMVGNPQAHITHSQTEATVRWLKAKGLIKRGTVASYDGSRSGGSRSGYATAIANAIASSWYNGSGSYRTIGIWGPGGGHAMAAWVAQDVAFFDPNYGEFWFQNRYDFIAWFPTFFNKAMYSLPKIGLCETYEVMDFGIEMKFKKAVR